MRARVAELRVRSALGARRVREFFEATTWLRVFVVNADNYRRPQEQVGVELRAMARSYKPAVIGVVEGLGNHLPELDGYVLLRDTSNKSRENVAAYVSVDLPLSDVRWVDMDHGWPRTEGPGTHEPRSILRFRTSRVRWEVAHDPDPRAKGPAREEHRHALLASARRHPRSPYILLEDANGNAPWLLRQVRKLRQYGKRVDTVLARGVLEGHAEYLDEFPRFDARGKFKFGGDHGHVLKVGLRIPVRFLKPPTDRTTDPRLSEVPS